MSFDGDYVPPGDVRTAVLRLRHGRLPRCLIAERLGLSLSVVDRILREATRA